MTEPSLRSSPTIVLDERPVVPAVQLHGPERLHGPQRLPETPPGSSPSAPVDGVAVIFFDPETGGPHLVFVSEGLAAMVGRGIDELLGGNPLQLFDVDGAARFDEVRRGLGIDRRRQAEERAVADLRPHLTVEIAPTPANDPGRPGPAIDLDADDPARTLSIDSDVLRQLGRRWNDQTPRVFAVTQELARAGRRPLPVHAAYSAIPSMTPLAPYVVAEFRDLEQPSAERLLADQVSVVRSLGRGYELGRVCHQVATQVEQELGDGSRCWVAVRSGDGRLEPVLTGGLPFEAVEGIIEDLLALGQPLSRRVVAVGALPERRAVQLRETSVVSLWYLPLVDEGGDDRAENGPGSLRERWWWPPLGSGRPGVRPGPSNISLRCSTPRSSRRPPRPSSSTRPCTIP